MTFKNSPPYEGNRATLEILSLAGRIGAAMRLANEGGHAMTAAAREAFMDRFETQVDPDGVLEPADRAQRASAARRAYFLRLALASKKKRAARKARVRDDG